MTVLTFLFSAFSNAEADLNVVRELVIAPKNARVLANIGSVNQSFNIRMAKALVDIHIGKLPQSAEEPVEINIHAVFTMQNESPDSLSLTVGFPVSNSEFSVFEFKSFKVGTDNEPRSVFNRTSGYPRKMNHAWISGPDKKGDKELPDYQEGRNRKSNSGKLFGQQIIGGDEFQNLMVWKETFDPHQVRKIQVDYSMKIPTQKNTWETKRAEGNYKGVWPEEANNLPLKFLNSIPYRDKYYFFDYYLVSGASWKGMIGEEIIKLHLDNSWQGHRLYSNYEHKLFRSGDKKNDEDSHAMTYTYLLQNAEPTENLLFALGRP
jgi:hypothetical protein